MRDLEMQKKVLNRIIKNCVDCPFIDMPEFSSTIMCNLDVRELFESEPDEHGNMIIEIPDWCHLDDADGKIRYQIRNNHGYDAGYDEGPMALFQTVEDADAWLEQLPVDKKDFTIQPVLIMDI